MGLVICGFLTNCCVESTMRTACEKGFNVVTLTDCCAATSQEGHDAATTGTFGMFSLPMTAADFAAKLLSADWSASARGGLFSCLCLPSPSGVPAGESREPG